MRPAPASRATLPFAHVLLAALLSLVGVAPTIAAPAAALLAAPSDASGDGWQAEIVYTEGRVARTSALALYDDDVHLVFYDEDTRHVRYAHWGGIHQDWVLAEAAGPMVYEGGTAVPDIEVAVDPGQNAHVVYENDDTIYYAFGDEADFVHEAIASGRRPVVATNEVGPVIAFIPPKYGGFHHTVAIATATESDWHIEAAFSDTLVRWQSFTLDRAMRVQLAVGGGPDTPYDQVYHVRGPGPAWLRTHVGQGYNPAIATDFSNNAHIVYSDGSALRYARWTGAAWFSQTVTTTVGTVTGQEVIPALALGLGDRPHLAFVDEEGLKYATQMDGVWLTSLVYGTDASGLGQVLPFSRVDLAVDENGRPHISFQEGPSDAGHATLDTPWHDQVVDARAPVAYTSLDASQNGRPRISYALQSGPQRGLSYAAFGDFSCSPPVCQPGWTLTPVALGDGADRGHYNSIMLRGVLDGEARVASYDPLPADLEYSFRTGAAWQTETVDSLGDVGRYADLELDVIGQPWIAYWDQTNYRVKLAWKDPAGWHIITNTVGPALNAESGRLALALPLSTSGLCCAYISYYDGVSDDLRVARWDGGAWTDELVANTGDVGSLSAIDFYAPSDPRLSSLLTVFYDAGHQVLRQAELPATLSGTTYFSYTAVPAAGAVTDLSELVTFNHGFGGLSVGYTTSGDNAVRVAHGVYSDWRVDTLASGGPTPRRYVAVDLSNYRLHATYVGAAGELVYATSSRTFTYMGFNPLQPCVEEPEEALAQFAAVPRAFVPLAASTATVLSDLDVLRAARDLFATDPDGQAYISLYYTHAVETGALAVADPDLAGEAYDLLQDFLPGLAALVSGQGHAFIIHPDLVDRTNHLADALTAAGSPALAAAIAAERARYNDFQDFAGLTFAQGAALMGIPVPAPVFLPLVRR